MINKENKNADTNFLQSLISEAKEEGEAKEILVDIKDILPVLKQYNEDLKVGQNNIINERLGMERMAHWYELLFKKLFDKYNELNKKIDSIDNHIDCVIEDAPKKLVVRVSASEADCQIIQSMFDQQIKKMIDICQQHLQEMNDLHTRQMQELNDRIATDTEQQYERGNEHRSEVNRMLKDSDGLYLQGIWNQVAGIFFWIGVVTVIAMVSIWIYNHCLC